MIMTYLVVLVLVSACYSCEFISAQLPASSWVNRFCSFHAVTSSFSAAMSARELCWDGKVRWGVVGTDVGALCRRAVDAALSGADVRPPLGLGDPGLMRSPTAMRAVTALTCGCCRIDGTGDMSFCTSGPLLAPPDICTRVAFKRLAWLRGVVSTADLDDLARSSRSKVNGWTRVVTGDDETYTLVRCVGCPI
jgi:hypothetical protein